DGHEQRRYGDDRGQDPQALRQARRRRSPRSRPQGGSLARLSGGQPRLAALGHPADAVGALAIREPRPSASCPAQAGHPGNTVTSVATGSSAYVYADDDATIGTAAVAITTQRSTPDRARRSRPARARPAARPIRSAS